VRATMSDKVNIAYCSNSIAEALHAALRAKRIRKINIDDIRAAIVGYLAAGPVCLDDYDFKELEDRTLRRIAEMVG